MKNQNTNHNEGATKMHGGKREGSGRKAFTEEQKAIALAAKKLRDEQQRQILQEELILPAVVTAFHTDPGKWKDRTLNVELSKSQIRAAYGAEGLKEWNSFFTLVKIGGRDRNGVGYKSRWVLNINKWGFVMALFKHIGYDPKNLPTLFFPPQAMLDRIASIETRRIERKHNKKETVNG